MNTRICLALTALLHCTLAACDTQPVVIVGKARSTPAPVVDAGRADAEAGRRGHEEDDEGEEEEEDDFVEYECTELEAVCGADGMTYQNACLAARAGVPVVRRGAC